VIKWDQEGFEALVHNLDVAKVFGGLGVWFSTDLASRVPIVLRLYTAHAVIIPGLILVLFILHALLVKRHKISPHPAIPHPEWEEPAPFTEHLKRAFAYGLVLIGSMSLLSALLPPAIGPTPVEGIETTRPLWMFWWFFPFEEWFGIGSVAVGLAMVFGLLYLVPFLDRSPRRRWQERPVTMAVAAVVVLILVAISVYVWINNPNGH
jgi:quinol-cytochrome oxidoreductase complex cytochrome b subunit